MPPGHVILRIGLRLIVIFGLVLAVKLGLDTLYAQIGKLQGEAAAWTMKGMLFTVLLGYALLLAVPFVPGVEIGLAILVIVGPVAAPFVYLATVLGLLIAFLVGHNVPLRRIVRLCDDLYLGRISALLQAVDKTPRDQRLAAMNDRLPNWAGRVLINYRYVMLGLAINLPGNVALGGGGGILMAAGLSRLFQARWIVLTVALATLPVPLAVWTLGTDFLS